MPQRDTERDSRTPFERFEDMTRRIVSVPRQDVPPMKHTPRTPNAKPSTTRRKPKPGE